MPVIRGQDVSMLVAGGVIGAGIVALVLSSRTSAAKEHGSSSSSSSSSGTSDDTPPASPRQVITKPGTPTFKSRVLESPLPSATKNSSVDPPPFEGAFMKASASDINLVQMDEGTVLSALREGTAGGESLIVGVAGGTGSGKTTLAKAIRKQLQTEISYLSHDNYYKDLRHLTFEEREEHNFDHPDALDTDLLFEHLRELKRGNAVDIPTYDFTTHSRTTVTERVTPRQIILVEGILIYTHPELRDEIDVKIFVDTADDVRLIRRMTRDLNERGRTADSVIAQYLKTVRPMHLKFVEPSKQHADVIVPVGLNQAALDMIIARLRFAAGE
jgi:uridine kinase